MSVQQPSLRPKDIITASLQKSIIVKLKSQKIIRGTLVSFDQHLNLFLMSAEELKEDGSLHLGNVVIRGDNVVLLIFPKEEGE
ncbi:MAG: LSM domain-containing protein [Candidatus Njordarchaeales archaeon]